MPKKRKSAESNDDERTNEVSESQVLNEDSAKHAKLDSLNDTTLQDLPIELIQRILVEAVAMEVRGWWLAKNGWKEKVDLVVRRLSDVCLQWSCVLTWESFRKELQRTLGGIAKETIRLEILDQSSIGSNFIALTALHDEIFTLCHQNCAIEVYDRSNLANVKSVIPLPGTGPLYMAACCVSNCLYVAMKSVYVTMQDDITLDCLTVLRITKDADHQFIISPWLKDYRLLISMISVPANGNLLIFSLPTERGTPLVSICDADGAVQHEIKLSPGVGLPVTGPYRITFTDLLQKANGNLVVVYVYNNSTYLCEIDVSASLVRQYQSSVSEASIVNFADNYGKIMITEPGAGIELLDSEFNHLGTYSPKPFTAGNSVLCDLHYESERNEIVHIYYYGTSRRTSSKRNALTRFRFV